MTTPDRTRTFSWPDPLHCAMAAKGRTGLGYLKAMLAGEIPRAPITHALDFDIVAAEEGFARFEGNPAEYHYNPMGTVHGGFAATMLDSALGCAVLTTLDADSAYVTAQLSVQLVRPITAATGRIAAEARIVHRGTRVATAEGRLTDARGALLAHATASCLIVPRSA